MLVVTRMQLLVYILEPVVAFQTTITIYEIPIKMVDKDLARLVPYNSAEQNVA